MEKLIWNITNKDLNDGSKINANQHDLMENRVLNNLLILEEITSLVAKGNCTDLIYLVSERTSPCMTCRHNEYYTMSI